MTEYALTDVDGGEVFGMALNTEAGVSSGMDRNWLCIYKHDQRTYKLKLLLVTCVVVLVIRDFTDLCDSTPKICAENLW